MSRSRDFVVSRADLRKIAFVPGHDPDDAALAPGQALLRVECFAFTANNVSYGVLGDSMSYWRFFPASEGWGRLPVWGFADIVRSRHGDLRRGERVYGLLPMSTHLLVSVDQVSQASFVDASPHRADLVPVYNRYTRTSADPTYDRSNDGRVAVLRPLFLGAFLFADFLIEHGLFGAQSVIVSSASSKTALAFASLVSERHSDRCEVIGLTSRNRTAFVEGTGYYRRALGYDQIPALASGAPSLFVDFAGNRTVVDAVHRKIGAHLKYSASLGVTHWDRTGEAQELPGPAPSSFSASHWASKRVADWGASGLQVRAADAMRQFLATARWLRIVNENGEAAVEARYRAALDDKIDPAQGCVLSLNPPREDCQR